MKRTLIYGGLLILLSNVAILAGVAWNRSGDPDSRVYLSQRELHPRYDWQQENSGIALNLIWRKDDFRASGLPQPTDRSAEQMQAMGFNVPASLTNEQVRQYLRQSPKPLLLVMELNGPPYRRSLERAHQAWQKAQRIQSANPQEQHLKEEASYRKIQWEYEATRASRLFFIDAGTSLSTLRQRYPDRERFLILPGYVRPTANKSKTEGWRLGGNVSGLLSSSINVPYRWRKVLHPVLPKEARTEAKFEVDVVFGQRLQPWIERIELTSP